MYIRYIKMLRQNHQIFSWPCILSVESRIKSVRSKLSSLQVLLLQYWDFHFKLATITVAHPYLNWSILYATMLHIFYWNLTSVDVRCQDACSLDFSLPSALSYTFFFLPSQHHCSWYSLNIFTMNVLIVHKHVLIQTWEIRISAQADVWRNNLEMQEDAGNAVCTEDHMNYSCTYYA